jgi:hypothetical protein
VQRCPGRPQARCDEETRVVILRASGDPKGVDDPLKRDGSSNHLDGDLCHSSRMLNE